MDEILHDLTISYHRTEGMTSSKFTSMIAWRVKSWQWGTGFQYITWPKIRCHQVPLSLLKDVQSTKSATAAQLLKMCLPCSSRFASCRWANCIECGSSKITLVVLIGTVCAHGNVRQIRQTSMTCMNPSKTSQPDPKNPLLAPDSGKRCWSTLLAPAEDAAVH